MNLDSVSFSSFLLELGLCGFNILRAINHPPVGVSIVELQLRLPAEGCPFHSEAFLIEKLKLMQDKGYIINEGNSYKLAEPMSAFLIQTIECWKQTMILIKSKSDAPEKLKI